MKNNVMNKKGPAPLVLTRQFKVSKEIIFDAWVKPEMMEKWLFKSPDNTITQVISNPRAGGAFSIVELTESGVIIDHFGQYLRVECPNNLAFTLQVPKHFPGVTEVHLTFESKPDDSCQLYFVQTGVDPSIVRESWKKMLEQLNNLVG